MIRPPSNQTSYDEFWSGDPAFVQPADPEKFKRARETGDWAGVLLEGSQPTKFVMQPLRGSQHRWIADQVAAGAIGAAQAHQLAFRCALQEVANFGDVAVKRTMHDKLGQIATSEIPDLLDAITTAIVSEIGDRVFARAQGLSPKS
jgi:hypothetical protein